jgi:hypothetical protein
MPRAAQQEKGNRYPAEGPSSYHKGQTGSGVKIHGKVTAMKGEKFSQGVDKQAMKLRQVWGKAKNAASKFGNF